VALDTQEMSTEAHQDYERRLARAVDDVLDGCVSSADTAAKNRRVSAERVRAAVNAARSSR
jgi:hypothetical protein